jgi:hypothetical protein
MVCLSVFMDPTRLNDQYNYPIFYLLQCVGAPLTTKPVLDPCERGG